MKKKTSGLSISVCFGIFFVLIFILVSILVITLVNREMRNEALSDAREKTRILLERNLATHHYFSQELKPKLFDTIAGSKSKDYFDPTWMSSTYAIRQIDKYFNSLDKNGDYYYKECAVNARSPQNEADDYERAFIEELNEKPDLLSRSEIRTIGDVDFFVTLRRGEAMEQSCLRCHSAPDNAPGDLVAQYGSERSFNRSIGEAVSAISIRVPLAKTYAATRATAIKLSVMLMVILSLTFSVLYFFTKRLVLQPLKIIKKTSAEISFNPEHLGDTIPLPHSKELGEVVSAFNNMSVKMRDNRDHLEDEVNKRTVEIRSLSQQYKQLIEGTENFVTRVDREGKFLYVNQTSEKIYGLRPEECIGLSVFDFVHPDDREMTRKAFAGWLVNKTETTTLENRQISRSGRVRDMLWTCTLKLDESGEVIWIDSIARDITERKDMQSRQQFVGEILEQINQGDGRLDIIRNSMRLIKQFTDFEAVAIRLREGEDFPYFVANGFSAEFIKTENYLCAQDENGKQIYDSQGDPLLECMCGNVLSGRTDPALPFFTEDGSFWTNSTTTLLASTSPEERQGQTRNHCNKAGYESVALIPLRSSDQIVGLLQLNDTRKGQFTPEMIGFFEGIGASIGIALARAKAEEEAKNLAKFPSENPFPVLRIAKDGTILYSNDAGLTLLSKWERQVGEPAPHDWCQLIGDVLDSNRNKIIEIKPGKRIISFVFAPVAKTGYVNVYGRDVTEQKEAEQALQKVHNELEKRVRERTADLNSTVSVLQEEVIQRMRAEDTLGKSEEKYRELVENANSIIMRRNVKGKITFFNEFAQKFFGYSEAEILGRNVIGTVIPKTDSAGHDLAVMVRDISKHPDKYHTNENENMRRNGERVWITWTNKPIRDKDGQVVEILAIGSDTTERKRQEEALQQSEARLADAQRIAHIGNWDWDIVSNQLWWSDEIYRIFGLRPQEFDVTYEAFLSHVHSDDREFVKQSVDKALYEYKPYSIDYRILRPDGTERIVYEQAEIIRDTNKSPIRMWGTVQDVTAQKQAEKKILDDQKQLRSLTVDLLLSEERERRKIAMDLHDSVGQILAFSYRELGTLQKSTPQELIMSLEEIRHHIEQAIKQTRTLTFDLSPPALYDLGLEAAVEELVEQFSKERNIECHFENLHQHKPFADHIKIFLYRSIRELLTNVAKHSTAKLVWITSSKVNNDIQVTVEDNGTGFDISKLKPEAGNSKGFGLFSIRERLRHIGGQLDIQPSTGNGTKITLLVPLKSTKIKKRRIRL